MKRENVNRSGFTLLELIFVIVVLGVVASLGSDIITKVYEGYIIQRAQYRADIKTELALEQIANRLRNAIPGTIIARPSAMSTTAVDVTSISGVDYPFLQWVGRDYDSFIDFNRSTDRRPGWSGFADVNACSKTTIATPGSNLLLADQVIKNLSNNFTNLNSAYVYFAGVYDSQGHPIGHPVNLVDSSHLSFDISGPKTVTERYWLAWSSYALSVENGDLYLYYMFSPRYGQIQTSAMKTLLLRNVSNFRYRAEAEGSIRIKLCKKERYGNGSNDFVISCKEKVVY